MRFSERHGYKKVRDVIQIESMDEPLRNALWSLLKIHVWDKAQMRYGVYSGYYLSDESNKNIRLLCEQLWLNYFKQPLDDLENKWTKVLDQLRAYFFQAEWYEIYDFVEFVAENYRGYNFHEAFTRTCNVVLEKEVSAYRFVNGLISRITEQVELDEIEAALAAAKGPVQMHLQRALELLSSRDNPDYRNSIKESISAVESLVAKTVGADKGTLGQLIKKLEDEIGLHPALKTAFSSLYGYASDEGGIRHAILEQKTILFEDAKFFLVVCSAFTNYVEAKVAGSG